MAVAEAAKAVAARVMAPDKNNPYGQAQEFQQVVIPDFLRSRRIAWLVAGIAIGTTVLSLTALVLLTPLKEKIPVPILVDTTTGYTEIVQTHVDINTLDAIQALDQYWIQRYVYARESFIPDNLATNYRRVEHLACDEDFANYAWLFNSDNDQNYLKLYKNNTVNVEIKSIHPFALDTSTDALRWRTYSVHLDRLIGPDSGRRDQVKRISYEVILAVRYQHIAGATELIRDNPLGFEACRYSRAQLIG